MRRVALAILALSIATGCSPVPKAPRFASWEPLTASIPPATDRAAARRSLAESRRLWKAFLAKAAPDAALFGVPFSRGRATAYTYVRAFQSDPDRVVFTIVAVENGRVVVRASIDTHPQRLDRRVWNDPEPRPLWVERGNRIGTTGEGAPALTIDELYDACETRVLGEHPELVARLYFHPNGLLMQCGFAAGECDDCSTVSIQSVSRYSVAQEPAWIAPSRWLCGADWGMFPPGAQDPLNPSDECRPALAPEPARQRHRESVTPEGSDTYEYAEDDAPGENAEMELEDICRIDPAACRTDCRGDCTGARWMPNRFMVCRVFPTRLPSFLEVGKRLPLDDWSFRFETSDDGIECHGETAARHLRPTTDGRTPFERWVREEKR